MLILTCARWRSYLNVASEKAHPRDDAPACEPVLELGVLLVGERLDGRGVRVRVRVGVRARVSDPSMVPSMPG